MKKKECPSCAMEIDAKSKVCPICAYEFSSGGGRRWIAIFLLLLALFWLIVQLM
jgi:hypothetical protein